MVADRLIKGLAPKLFNDHVVTVGKLSSYDILGYLEQWF